MFLVHWASSAGCFHWSWGAPLLRLGEATVPPPLGMVQRGERMKIQRNGRSGKVSNQTRNQSDKAMQQLSCSPCPEYSDVTVGGKVRFVFCLHCSAPLSPPALGWRAQAAGTGAVLALCPQEQGLRGNSTPQVLCCTSELVINEKQKSAAAN